MPDWVKKYLDESDKKFNDIINDPVLIVEGLGQGMSDTYEEEGLAYCMDYKGRIVVNGITIEYRAYRLSDGFIKIGTYYVVK